MPEIEVRDKNNKVVEKLTLPESIFGLQVRSDLLHEAVVNYLANQRQGTHATKTRGLVRGGGKKPFRQKGTGRARQGSIRSPLMKGGGTVFGPQPRDYYYKMPKKQKRLALKTALSSKMKDGQFSIIDSIDFEKPKTKDMLALLEGLGINGKSVLVVIPEKNDNVYLSARNIPGVNVVRAVDLNTYELMVHKHVLMTRDALNKVLEVWG
jgi:large subunit ribosomal protein L4